MKKTLEDVAKAANVSLTTVSRVINNRGYISKKTKKKVFDTMDEIGYYPNEIARSLTTKKSGIIGLIFPTLTNPFQAELIQEIETLLADKNYKILLCNSRYNPEKEKKYLTMLRRNQVEGIIVGAHNENIDDYDIPHLPVVAVDRFLSDNIVTVSCDNYNGGKLAVKALIDSGCKNILCIHGNLKIMQPANERIRAYKELMDEYALPHIYSEVEFTKTLNEKYNILKDTIIKKTEIDGIFAGDDSCAILCLNILDELGKKVPDDIKIIGFDGATQTLAYFPKLTTIKQPISQIAETTVNSLLKKIDGINVGNTLNLPVKLIKGNSI